MLDLLIKVVIACVLLIGVVPLVLPLVFEAFKWIIIGALGLIVIAVVLRIFLGGGRGGRGHTHHHYHYRR